MQAKSEALRFLRKQSFRNTPAENLAKPFNEFLTDNLNLASKEHPKKTSDLYYYSNMNHSLGHPHSANFSHQFAQCLASLLDSGEITHSGRVEGQE